MVLANAFSARMVLVVFLNTRRQRLLPAFATSHEMGTDDVEPFRHLVTKLVSSKQKIEDMAGLIPVLRARVLEVWINNLERPRKCDAQCAGNFGQPGFGCVAVRQVEGRPHTQVIEDWLALDFVVDVAERMYVLL